MASKLADWLGNWLGIWFTSSPNNMNALQACQTNTNDFQKRTNIDDKDGISKVVSEARRQLARVTSAAKANM